MNAVKRIAVLSAVSATLATTAVVTAPTASADSYNGCAWPNVCFYLTQAHWDSGTPTAAYQDVTSSYQNLGPRSRGADYVHNTRNDDRAYLRVVLDSSGTTFPYCLDPNRSVRFLPGYTVTGIRIETDPACP